MPSEQNGSKRQILSRKGGSSHKTVNQFFVCLLNLGYLGILHAHREVCAENHKRALSLELLIIISNTVDGDQCNVLGIPEYPPNLELQKRGQKRQSFNTYMGTPRFEKLTIALVRT